MVHFVKKFIPRSYACMRGKFLYSASQFGLHGSMWPNVKQSISSSEKGESEGRKFLVMMHSGQLTDLYINCFKSARLRSPDTIIEFFTDFTHDDKNILRTYGINFHDIGKGDFAKKRTALKIEPLKYLDLRYGDQVIISDVDVLFQADPFSVFNNDFDVFYTSRHYTYHYPINAGIWGFRVNKTSQRFVSYYIRQLYTKSWSQLRKFKKRFNREPYGFDWYDDQDFLCVVYENLGRLPKEIADVRFYDAGFKYNYCPSFDIYGQSAIQDLKSKLGNSEYVVLHLKGELKQIINARDLP